MLPARMVAAAARRLQFVARVGAPFINTAAHLLADFAAEGRAAWPRVVGAAHTPQAIGHGLGQALRHAAAFALQLVHRKIHPKSRAASAAADAGVGIECRGCGFNAPSPSSRPRPARPAAARAIAPRPPSAAVYWRAANRPHRVVHQTPIHRALA